MSERIPVAVLAATGSVGQRFVQLLDGHPWFEVVALTGSDRSVGQTYGESCHWFLSEPMPVWAAKMKVVPTEPGTSPTPLVFSALPADIARTVEPEFAKAGMAVCSNASAYRREVDVPILLPEINAQHAGLVTIQRRKRGWKGCIVTNPNCTSTGLTVAMKVLDQNFGLKKAFVVSLQALSGAGYPGVSSLDILDNVIPYIGGEEDKVEWEPRKMIGRLEGDTIRMSDCVISAHTNRVAVSDGHIVCLSVELDKKPERSDVFDVLSGYEAPAESCDLPSAPHPVILMKEEVDRPQPRQDRMAGKGMTTVIGRLRPDPLFDYKMVILSHNTIRGAAGGSIYNGELLVKMGLVGTKLS
ncbi:MAG: aspartate-semialdehyde dehydrogenase [Anaerolineaceae bacterium]|nr:aspartate-semialdehyde dehydrogenase [Anaerolineaceae bacterium]